MNGTPLSIHIPQHLVCEVQYLKLGRTHKMLRIHVLLFPFVSLTFKLLSHWIREWEHLRDAAITHAQDEEEKKKNQKR